MQIKQFLSRLFPFSIGVAATLVCCVISLTIFVWLGKPAGFVLFLPAIIISSWYGGFVAGIVADVLSTFAIYYFLVPPYNAFLDKSLVTVIQLVLFILEGLFISYIIDHGHRHEKISQYKKTEKENKKTIEELQQQLVKTKSEIASRDEFLSIASHELKTPLTTVLLQIQTTLHSIKNVSLAEFSVANLLNMLQSAEAQTKRLSKMINDLLNISLLTTHRLTLELEEVDLTTLTKDAVESFIPKFAHEGSGITFHATESIIGKWDKLRMEQAIDNLISNALKYGNKKPVEVSLYRDGDLAIFQIVDQGIGISSTDKDKIFLLFQRGEATEKDYRGLGIGLFITREIITLHGGTIAVKTRQGDGTTFTVSLPIKK